MLFDDPNFERREYDRWKAYGGGVYCENNDIAVLETIDPVNVGSSEIRRCTTA
jgi:hypothetical protein